MTEWDWPSFGLGILAGAALLALLLDYVGVWRRIGEAARWE
jgi:hypothetical protein